jgi:hypothetical protein
VSVDYTNFKQQLYQQLLKVIQEKKGLLNTSFTESRKSLESEAKSTAGDKHETGRAMIQLEQEKMGKQLREVQKLEQTLVRVPHHIACTRVESGALVETNVGFFFISVGLGKIELENKEIIAIAPRAPLAQKMLGLEAKSSFDFNGRRVVIRSIY